MKQYKNDFCWKREKEKKKERKETIKICFYFSTANTILIERRIVCRDTNFSWLSIYIEILNVRKIVFRFSFVYFERLCFFFVVFFRFINAQKQHRMINDLCILSFASFGIKSTDTHYSIIQRTFYANQ